MKHRLKILQKYAELHLTNRKFWEIRKFDRDYKKGDSIEFTFCDNETGEPLEHISKYTRNIDYVFLGGRYGLEEGYCILSVS